jgi:hypothetical protein
MSRRLYLNLFTIVILLGSLLAACGPEPGLVSDVYLSPSGNDSGNCQTPAAACATFGRALPLVERGGTVHLAAGSYQPDQVVIQKLVTVEGAGRGTTTLYTTSSRSPSIFEVSGGGWLLLSGVTLSGERLTGDGAIWGILQRDGTLLSIIDCTIRDYTGIYSGGISNEGGMLVVEHSTFDNNQGGIYNANLHGSRTHVSDSEFNGNSEGFHNGTTGYAIIDSDTRFAGNLKGASNLGILRINDSSFSGSTSVAITNSGSLLALNRVYIYGSVDWGIRNEDGHVTINASDLSNNSGTAISITGGTLDLSRSVIRENHAEGILIGPDPAGGRTVVLVHLNQVAIVSNQGNGIKSTTASAGTNLQNVTVSSNNRSGIGSGGISLSSGGNLIISDSTIVRNQGTGIAVSGGTSTVDIRRSVVADNTIVQCGGSALPFRVDNPAYICSEGLTLGMLNMGGLTGEGDTFVHPLLDGSPLIDIATPGCPGVDQRGAARPVGGGCDIGAYEYQFALTADEGTGGIIPLPTQTPESHPKPQLTFTTDTNCRKGPGTRYNVLSQVAAGTMLEAQGRSADNAWWYVVPGQAAQGCWVGDSTVDKQGSPEGATVMTGPTLPDPPEGFDAKQACDTKAKTHIVKLNWIGQAGATGYRIYRNGKLVSAPGANASSYNDNAPFGGAGLLYEIESLNEDGASIRVPLSVPPCG